MKAKKILGVLAAASWLAVGPTAVAVNIETVPVGNPGNAGEWSGESYGGRGPDAFVGGVAYEYNIGKYEVTAGQYTEFLNAVAATDDYGLYNQYMWESHPDHGDAGCKIERFAGNGTAGDPYQYRVAIDWANRPVNYVSWGDAVRFANWLHNGQPTGTLTGDPILDAALTEDGAYFLDGATSDAELLSVSREADWKWAITSEDEWYKAAYYKPATGSYYDYPTSSDSLPSNDLVEPTDPGNNATFYLSGGDYTIGGPYWHTEAGAHENSDSPYGTFDQGGNVWEWNEAISGSYRGLRGAGAGSLDYHLHAASSHFHYPATEYYGCGFRVSEVPEPATLSLLALGGLAMLRRRRLGGSLSPIRTKS